MNKAFENSLEVIYREARGTPKRMRTWTRYGELKGWAYDKAIDCGQEWVSVAAEVSCKLEELLKLHT